ncbi:extracellular solute-binding protein [Palleronia sp. KMU-117]|uniref:extracellular solute-binding protein n=1 Tax=Palleronia sp. KMU-117 TaxID=3434108 RepID=UPI003D735064
MIAAARLTFALSAALILATAHPAPAQTTVSHGISTFGELKYPADFPHFDYVNPAAPKGGIMSFRGTGASQTFDSLNAFILQGEPAQGLTRLYDTLLARAYDEPDAVYGLLAERLEYPEDRSWVVFTLREGAAFADGTAVTADDVVFTFETLKEKGAPRYQLDLRDVALVTALSEREVRFDFAEGAATRDLIATVGQYEILPAHYYQTTDFESSTLVPPLGSGPYIVRDLTAGRTITYCLNPDYWGANLPVNIGKNNFDCIRYEYFADNTASFEALKAGAYLFHEENFSAQWATGYDFPALASGWVIRETIPDDRPSGAQGFWFNLRRPQFEDARVREALGMMFNFEWSNQTLFAGLYERTDSFWENSVLQASGPLEGDELVFLERWRDRLPETVFSGPAFTPPVSAPNALDRAMARRAGALLDAAGWEVGDDGMRRDASGQALRVEFLNASPTFERIILPYVENLRAIGVDAVHTLVDFAQYEQRQEDFDYDIVSGRFVLPLSPSIELRELFGSDSANAPGTFNLSGLADPVIDEIIEEVVLASDRATLETRVRALDRVLRDRRIWVPNWYKGTHWLAYWDVFGRPETKPPYDRGTDYWWWDKAKYDALQAAGALR